MLWFSEDLSSQFTANEVNIETGYIYLKENLELCMRRDERGGSEGVPFSPGVGNSLEKDTATEWTYIKLQILQILSQLYNV